MRNSGTTTTTHGLPSKYCFTQKCVHTGFYRRNSNWFLAKKVVFFNHCFQLPVRMKHLGKDSSSRICDWHTYWVIHWPCSDQRRDQLLIFLVPLPVGILIAYCGENRNIKFMLFIMSGPREWKLPQQKPPTARPSPMEEDRWKQTTNTNVRWGSSVGRAPCLVSPHDPDSHHLWNRKYPKTEPGWPGNLFQAHWTWYHRPNIIPCHLPLAHYALDTPAPWNHQGHAFTQGSGPCCSLHLKHSSLCHAILHMTGSCAPPGKMLPPSSRKLFLTQSFSATKMLFSVTVSIFLLAFITTVVSACWLTSHPTKVSACPSFIFIGIYWASHTSSWHTVSIHYEFVEWISNDQESFPGFGLVSDFQDHSDSPCTYGPISGCSLTLRL